MTVKLRVQLRSMNHPVEDFAIWTCKMMIFNARVNTHFISSTFFYFTKPSPVINFLYSFSFLPFLNATSKRHFRRGKLQCILDNCNYTILLHFNVITVIRVSFGEILWLKTNSTGSRFW